MVYRDSAYGSAEKEFEQLGQYDVSISQQPAERDASLDLVRTLAIGCMIVAHFKIPHFFKLGVFAFPLFAFASGISISISRLSARQSLNKLISLSAVDAILSFVFVLTLDHPMKWTEVLFFIGVWTVIGSITNTLTFLTTRRRIVAPMVLILASGLLLLLSKEAIALDRRWVILYPGQLSLLIAYASIPILAIVTHKYIGLSKGRIFVGISALIASLMVQTRFPSETLFGPNNLFPTIHEFAAYALVAIGTYCLGDLLTALLPSKPIRTISTASLWIYVLHVPFWKTRDLWINKFNPIQMALVFIVFAATLILFTPLTKFRLDNLFRKFWSIRFGNRSTHVR